MLLCQAPVSTNNMSGVAAQSLGLESYLVAGVPSSIYYIPSFLLPSTCDALLTAINSTSPHKWTNLTHRRLLSLPSPLTGKARDTLLVSTPLPTYLTEEILPRFQALGIFDDSTHKTPNHVLVNEYLPGQGIMPHEDGPAYHPVTATISLGGSVVLDVHDKSVVRRDDGGPKLWRILQEPGSLLVTKNGCYTNTLHGIAENEIDEELGDETIANWDLLGDKEQFSEGKNMRTTRISLTYRDVKRLVHIGGGARTTNLGRR